MCFVESLNMTDIVAMLRRMLQSRASSGDVASVGAANPGSGITATLRVVSEQLGIFCMLWREIGIISIFYW